MKKILSALLIGAIFMSLTACGKDAPKEPVETVPAATQSTVDTTGPQTINGKQEFWENIIKKKTYHPDTKSFNLVIKDCLDVTVYNDDRGMYSCVFSETRRTNDFNGLYIKAIYKENKDSAFFRETTNATVKGESVFDDKWQKLPLGTSEERGALNQFIEYTTSDKLTGLSLFEEEMKNLQTVEYVQTVDGKDELLLHCVEEDKSKLPLTLRTDALSTYEYALYEVEHKGEKGTLVFLSHELPIIYIGPAEPEVDNSKDSEDETTEPRPLSEKNDTYAWVDEPSWAKDLSADMINKKFMLGDTEIKWTLKQDLLKKPDRFITTYIKMIMNPAKQTVCSMSMEKDDLSIHMNYVECDRAVDILEMPFFVEEHVVTEEILAEIKNDMARILDDYLVKID